NGESPTPNSKFQAGSDRIPNPESKTLSDHIPNPESRIPSARSSAVARVLIRVLFLNLSVALAKIVFGYSSGAISILSDGFHSLTAAASNIVGLIGARAAGRPPDEEHPYGHRKYETVAAAALTLLMLSVMIEVLRNAFNHLTGRRAPREFSFDAFLVMLV